MVVNCAPLSESTSAPAASPTTRVRVALTTTVSAAVSQPQIHRDLRLLGNLSPNRLGGKSWR